MLLFLAEVVGSLFTALNRITSFGRYPGFKVNWEKSLICPISPEYSQSLPDAVPLKIVFWFRYPGVEVQLSVKVYIKNNF